MSQPSSYPVTLRALHDEDGGGYIAVVHDLPGCLSDGATPEEAYANALDAIASWIEAANDMGRSIPEPSPHLPELRKAG